MTSENSGAPRDAYKEEAGSDGSESDAPFAWLTREEKIGDGQLLSIDHAP
jgi:hypothetical protein